MRVVRERAALLEPQIAARVAEVAAWPVGRVCPLGRLREAWVVRRHGLAMVVQSGAWSAGRVRPGLAARVGQAIALYERHAARRPDGWPESGVAALVTMASLAGADWFAGDVERLLGLAKGMRALALLDDPGRLERARARAAARAAPPPPGRFVFRIPDSQARRPRLETAEWRRQCVRDAVLLLGDDPAAWPNASLALEHLPIRPGAAESELVDEDPCAELDGIGARAHRYRADLAAGRWQPPEERARVSERTGRGTSFGPLIPRGRMANRMTTDQEAPR